MLRNFMKPLVFIFLIFVTSLLFPQEMPLGDIEEDDYFFEDDTGITITGTVQTSQQISIVDREEIEKHGSADLGALLQDSLNLGINRYGAYGNQAGITLRGFDSKRAAFLIDGVPANSAMDGKFDIYQIDLNNIERIEVIYGGSDTKFNVSGAVGGIVNIITVKKQNQGWKFGSSISNTSAMPGKYRDREGVTQNPRWEDIFDMQNFTLSAAYGSGKSGNSRITEAFSFSANAFYNRAANHFLFRDYMQYIRRKDNNEVWDSGLSASMVWNFPNLTKLITSSKIYYGDKNVPLSGFSGNFGNQRDFTSRQSLMIEIPRALHDNLSTEASLTWNFSNMNYTPPTSAAPVEPSMQSSRHNQNTIGAINRWNWYAGDKLTMKFGADYSFIFLDSTGIGRRSRHDGGLYSTADYKPVRQFLITSSLKTVYASNVVAANNNLQGITVVPKLGMVWNINDSLSLKNNYFRSFKYPDFEELYWSSGSGYSGNPNLLPEDGWGGDIGVEFDKNKIKFESVFFAQWLKDSIHWFAGNGGLWRPMNVGEAIFFGFDNKISFDIPVSFWKLNAITPSLTYKYLRSYLLSFGYTYSSNKRIPYNPEHTIGGSVDISWNNGSLLVSGHFESLRYSERSNIIKLNPYFLLNAAINQKLGKIFTVFGSLNNILNQSYESFYDYPMPGITMTLGMKANLEIK